ncbi:F-type H+-transporting ATPase subunit delta [Persephonella hydrogeniphila]|uniref:ATP synthase subunit delta n=1 Tax=Persephonella hydrogeniphila TaxID=198703 RepID=A0A285NBD3_9AQUI|nr:ATP synthase F1 subunit delta [Persephonella hydrogeniphila]SNZ06618.1 F-type H+-transporting ATPase subunit delta [Persephonella hydrogeniphila]
MKIDKKVLKRVVKVLLNKIPREEAALIKVSDDLSLVQELYRKDKSFRNFVLNPQLSFEDKEKVIEILSEKAKLDKNVVEAIKYLVKINKGNVLREISDQFRFEVEKFFATVKGEVITAYPIDEELLNNIKKAVEDKLGKKVEFEVKQDSSIIGGVVVKAGSYVLDSSVRTYLRKLEQQLTSY